MAWLIGIIVVLGIWNWALQDNKQVQITGNNSTSIQARGSINIPSHTGNTVDFLED